VTLHLSHFGTDAATLQVCFFLPVTEFFIGINGTGLVLYIIVSKFHLGGWHGHVLFHIDGTPQGEEFGRTEVDFCSEAPVIEQYGHAAGVAFLFSQCTDPKVCGANNTYVHVLFVIGFLPDIFVAIGIFATDGLLFNKHKILPPDRPTCYCCFPVFGTITHLQRIFFDPALQLAHTNRSSGGACLPFEPINGCLVMIPSITTVFSIPSFS